MKPARLLDVVGAALGCSLFAYLPLPGVRGAGFCLFPGVALRSRRLASKGSIAGFCADIIFEIISPFICIASTHSNRMQFTIELVVWTAAMYAIWMWLWSPPLYADNRVGIHGIGALAVIGASIVFWAVSPLDRLWPSIAIPFGDLAPVTVTVILLSSIPICSLIVALLIRSSAEANRAAEHESNQPANGERQS